MIRFILNKKTIATNMPAGMLLLDFVRYQQQLTGTKIGCREGDCGACTVLIGELINNQIKYKTATSCLTPIGNVQGKHVVTIEGINQQQNLNPVQNAMCTENATQCGFCTPGFVVSLTGFCLADKEPTQQNAVASIDGNICRCTGYKSIQRAAEKIAVLMQQNTIADKINFLVQQQILPNYFLDVPNQLQQIFVNASVPENNNNNKVNIGGGTDLYVQKHDAMVHAPANYLFNDKSLKPIYYQNDNCFVGGAATVTDLQESREMQQCIKHLSKYIKLVSSTPIRNIATVAGNIVNASPIGDLTIMFLALNAMVVLKNGEQKRTIALKNFYKGYKQIDKQPEEIIEQIFFAKPTNNSLFNFEKVSKRTHLDIASVNTALQICVHENIIVSAALSAGGVGPIPTFLQKTSDSLVGKKICSNTINEAIEIAKNEISPISDARGSEAYKRLLLSQLIKAHFIEMGFEL